VTYGDAFRNGMIDTPTAEETQRRIIVINMLREREACAKIAASFGLAAGGHAIAEVIRSQPIPGETVEQCLRYTDSVASSH
jgi:hypothetical protein